MNGSKKPLTAVILKVTLIPRDLAATLRKTIVLIIIISIVTLRIIRANLLVGVIAPLVILVPAARGGGRRFITKGGGG